MTDQDLSHRSEQLHKFPGGLRLAENKEASTAQSIKTLPPPKKLILPLQQHAGVAPTLIVKPGQRVLKGEKLARADHDICVPIHAPTSGTILEISEHLVPHPSGLTDTCIILEPDGKDESCEWQKIEDYRSTEPEILREHVREAGIVGLGGAVFPTYIKLNATGHGPIECLILNGAECEPYISCDDMLMRERAAEILEGARIMLYALQTNHCVIAVEDNKPEAQAALQAELDRLKDKRLELVPVPSIYPEGGEKQLIQVLTGKEVPHDGLPVDIGLVCHNTGTAAAIYRAVVEGEPLIRRIVTVTGAGVKEPRNLEVLLGTPFSELIAACGGYAEDAARLIMGGPMMGVSVKDDSVPVIKATNCVLAASAAEIQIQKDPMPCIRCADCAQACPASLLPQQLYWHIRAQDLSKTQDYNLFDCIECGCCDYVCPSHIPLVSYFRFAKTEIWAQEREREKADHARDRFTLREQRITEEKQAQAERHRKKTAALNQTAKKTEIQAAVDRVKAKKTGHKTDDEE
ncbi:MAG: electron transport complex subunit RsxC [Gammaproteobacteria bacterium]|nr:electron transport complex subunit RsxC [Gammaproteobacteria bacterium]